MQTVYQEHGFKNRGEYLQALAENNGLELATVRALAAVLGPLEDFDGLVCAVEDAAAEKEF